MTSHPTPPMSRCRSLALPAPLATAASALALLTAAALAQDAAPVFRADAQVVVLDVTARDGHGGPVPDLRREEVQVFEDGRPCEIQSFRLVRARSAPPRAVPTAGPRPAGNAAVADTASASRANLVVLVFDAIPVADADFARQGATSLLSQPFPPNTWFAVYKIDRSMRLLQPFTANPARLESAVRAATTGDEGGLGAAAASLQSLADAPPPGLTTSDRSRPDLPPTPNLAGIAGDVESELGDLARRNLAWDSLYGLLALARGLEPVRGRKTIVYFAEAREVPDSATPAYETTVGAANRAGVTIHTVDARGLAALRPGGLTAFDQALGRFTAASGTAGSSGPPAAATPATASSETPDTGGGPLARFADGVQNPLWGSYLERVASDTGGLAIAGTNDLARGLSRVVEELGQYYEVVYAPPRPEPDGRFRRIEARTSRRGVRLRTRAGYFATPSGTPTLRAHELPLLAALAAHDAPHDFAHEASVLHFGSRGNEREALFLAEVPLAGIQLEADAVRGVVRGQLALLGFVKDDSGRPVARFSQDWPIEGPLADAARLAGTTAVLRRSLSLPPGGYSLETAVEDRKSSRASVGRTRFTVPPIETGLALGSLAVVRRATAAQSGNEFDPLRVSGVSIAPHLGRPRLPASAKEVALFLAVYPSLAPDAPTLRLELWRAGEAVARTSPALPPAGPDGRIVWIGGLSTKGLRPGSYEVVATVRQRDATAEERAGFAIGDGVDTPPAATEAKAVPPVPPDLVPVLDAAARYVVDYEQAFRDVAAEESYTQWAAPRDTPDTGVTVSCAASLCRRVTRADVVFVRLAGAIPWGCFRDVHEVDGRKLRDREGRLEALFAGSTAASAARRVRAILDESARYNIGPAMRNLNFPTLPLLFLHPLNQRRFAWSRGGKRRFGTVEGVELQFDELARPTLVDRGGRGDLPAKGRFWVDPARGTVLRSETTFRFERDGHQIARAFVSAEYRPEPRLGMWVPSEMREEYEDLPGSGRTFGEPSEATARYGEYRRFTVTTEEEAKLGGESQPQPQEPKR